MHYFDVVFPLALAPLTYICPEDLADKAEPGMLVSAPLRGKTAKGILWRKNASRPHADLREISEIHFSEPGLSRNMLRLLQWMSDYYIAKEGLVLKQTLPAEFFERTRPRRTKEPDFESTFEFSSIPVESVAPVISSVTERRYRTFLLHAPNSLYEASALLPLVETTRNIIILLPEIHQADMIFASLEKAHPGRTCIIHSGISKGRRSEYIEGISSGRYDIVVGTRMALFVPLKKVSLIVVMNEHSSFYKMEEGIRYSVRDAAVMRGYFEKATVLLSSVAPSADSYFNAMAGKYSLISPDNPSGRPKVSISDMRYARKASPTISETAVNLASKKLTAGGNVMIFVNRKGYSSLLCEECENIETCPDCQIALVMHKEGMLLRCNYCGRTTEVPRQCGRCGSVRLQPAGSGTERVEEEIRGLLDTEPVRVDTDRIKRQSDFSRVLKGVSLQRSNLLIGTRLLTSHLWAFPAFSLAVVLNADALMNHPDFRASEKAYAGLSEILDRIGPDGVMIIQTRRPGNPVLKAFKSGDYRSFMIEELKTRESIDFPPYAKMALITVSGNAGLADRLVATLMGCSAATEVLGPVPTRDKRRGMLSTILIKAKSRTALNRAVRTAIAGYAGRRDVRIDINIDPY